ncbi:MAG: 16S rRNA maturation RNase YbeY [Armatimonadetes bacterium OLB18]|nr:MAG: 16S rRNA maturation RNase YbeY [Armatimonadetes bacterium OLB18]
MAQRQAALRGVEPELEIAWLALHGALHLVGFGDDSEADRAAMLAEMNSIAQDQGLDPQQDWSSIYAESQGVES